MSKYTIKMTVVTPTNIPNNKSVEFNLHRFIIADTIQEMLYKAVNLEKDYTGVKHLNAKIEE